VTDPHEDIGVLESQIAELSEAAEQCRRIRIAAKAITVAGSLLLIVTVLGTFGSGALALVLGIAAVLGGLALLGSNERTHQEIAASIKAHEAKRAELIDGLLLVDTERSGALN
jgi:hypothetical protein